MNQTIRIGKNGCGSEVDFRGKKVYFHWENYQSHSILGGKLDKTVYIKANIDRPDNDLDLSGISKLMMDWELYENGWLVTNYKNKNLFYYLTQIGDYGQHRPAELKLFKNEDDDDDDAGEK